MQPGLVQQAAGHVQSSSMSIIARWRTLEAVIVPIVLALRHPAQGRLILHGVGLPPQSGAGLVWPDGGTTRAEWIDRCEL